MLAANIDPKGMIDFFKILVAEEEKSGVQMDGVLEFISTHPDTKERVSTLEAKLKGLPKERVFEPIAPALPSAETVTTPEQSPK